MKSCKLCGANEDITTIEFEVIRKGKHFWKHVFVTALDQAKWSYNDGWDRLTDNFNPRDIKHCEVPLCNGCRSHVDDLCSAHGVVGINFKLLLTLAVAMSVALISLAMIPVRVEYMSPPAVVALGCGVASFVILLRDQFAAQSRRRIADLGAIYDRAASECCGEGEFVLPARLLKNFEGRAHFFDGRTELDGNCARCGSRDLTMEEPFESIFLVGYYDSGRYMSSRVHWWRYMGRVNAGFCHFCSSEIASIAALPRKARKLSLLWMSVLLVTLVLLGVHLSAIVIGGGLWLLALVLFAMATFKKQQSILKDVLRASLSEYVVRVLHLTPESVSFELFQKDKKREWERQKHKAYATTSPTQGSTGYILSNTEGD